MRVHLKADMVYVLRGGHSGLVGMKRVVSMSRNIHHGYTYRNLDFH